MWKNLLNKGKCLVGFHEGPWGYQAASQCVQVQVCVRCGRASERTEHQWTEWAFESGGRCDMARRCERCAAAEKQVTHAWGEPQYSSADACDRLSTCGRCRETKPRDVLHVLDAWSYQSADTCTQVVACSRCRAAGSATRLEHDWDEWTRSEFYETMVRVCRHCGEMLLDVPVPGGGPVVMQSLEADVNRLMAADSASQLRAVLTQPGSALLTPAADKYFQFAFDQYADDAFRSGPLTAALTLVSRCRAIGVDATLQELGLEAPPAAPQAAPPSAAAAPAPRAIAARGAATGPLDQRLIGHWRNTEFLGQGTPMMMSIESHCVLDGSGRFEFVVGSNDVEAGTWTGSDGELVLRFDDGTLFVRSFVVDSGGMIWNNDSRFHFWSRIG